MGYKKRRARNQARRALRRRWVAGERMVIGHDVATSQVGYASVASITLIAGTLDMIIEGVNEKGSAVREGMTLTPIYAETFDQVLFHKGLKNNPAVYVVRVSKIELPADPFETGSLCGVDCTCCEFEDGTTPYDHDEWCFVFDDGNCNCDAVERAEERRRDGIQEAREAGAEALGEDDSRLAAR